jgi:hypothetical protein
MRTRLRVLISTIDRQIAQLARQPMVDSDHDRLNELAASWTRLVEELALGPEPQVRQCPACGQIIRQSATRCGHCWKSLLPCT